MSGPFDPYREWLGIPDGPRPPGHYQLLGLTPQEADPQAIAVAAEATLARIRKIRPGPQAGEWGRLLDEIAAAKACLLDPARKAAYDAQSRVGQGRGMAGGTSQTDQPPMEVFAVTQEQPATAAPPDLPIPAAPAISPMGPIGPIAPMPRERRPAEDDNPWRSWLMTGVLVAVGVTLAGVVAGLLNPAPPPRPVAKAGPEGNGAGLSSDGAAPSPKRPELSPSVDPGRPPAKPDAKPEPRPELPKPKAVPQPQPETPRKPKPPTPPPPQPKPGVESEPFLDPLPRPEPPGVPQPKAEPPPEKPQPDDAQKRAAFDRAVAAVRQAMARRDLAASRRHLQSVAANAQGQDDQAQLERLQVMLNNLEQFWRGIRIAMAKLRPTEELALKDNRAAVVAASADELTLHIYGQTQRYRIETMPAGLVMTLSEFAFIPTPGSKAVIATFLAVDPQGDRAAARRLWEEAARGGLGFARELIRELDAPRGPPAKLGPRPTRQR